MLRLALTAAVLVGGAGLDAAALALLISSVVSSVAAAAALHRMLAHLPGSEVATPARELASFSMLSWVASMATQGLLWADILILGVLVSAEEVGAYQVAARVVLIGMFVITPLTASMAPRIAHAWAHDDRGLVTQRYVGTVLWSSRLSFPVLAGLLAVPTAVLHLFGDDFGAARGVVVILAVGAVAEAVGAPSSVVLNQIGRNRLNMGLNLTALVLNIGLNLLLIPPFGIEGSAFAWAVTLVAGAVVRIVVLRRVATERWPWSPQLAAAAVGGVLACGAAALAAAPLPPGSALRILVGALAVVVVYGVVIGGFGLDREERDTVSRTASLKLPALRRWRVQWRLRKAEASAERLDIDELISPFRLDVLARAELFRLARAHQEMRRDRLPDFVALVRNSRYGEWFDQVLVARGYASGTARTRERMFRSIVVASLQLMDRHDRLGREALGKVTVTRVPAGTPLGGWALGEDRWVLLDGGHRVALALLAGETALGPDDYVVESDVRPPNNTASFLDAGRTTSAEALAFLARGLLGAGDRAHATTWEGLLDHLAEPANRAALQGWPHAAWLAGLVTEATPAAPDAPVSPSGGR